MHMRRPIASISNPVLGFASSVILTKARIIAASSHQNVNADILLDTSRSTTDVVANMSSAVHTPMILCVLSEHMSCMLGRLHMSFIEAIFVAIPASGAYCMADAIADAPISAVVGDAPPVGMAMAGVVEMDVVVVAIPAIFIFAMSIFSGLRRPYDVHCCYSSSP